MRNKVKPAEEKILDIDADMQGALTFRDPVNIRINGKFEGELDVKGSLTIAETAVVDAEIKGDDVIIAGRLKGNIFANGKVLLKTHAVVQGDIRTQRLAIEEGATFEGTSKMLKDVFDIDELAKYLEVESSSILEWINQGKVPVFKENGNWHFERKRIDDWISSEKV